jgi:hypothetical protein
MRLQLHLSPRFGSRTRVVCSLTAACLAALMPLSANAQYVSTNLVSNASGALQQDANLIDGWGLVSLPTTPRASL